MDRTQFMTELAALLQDISAEERVEAMRYYNDYFDEAGEDKEADIIKELESPAKVAAEVKAGLGKAAGESGEFRETGYTDTRFERRDTPAHPGWEKGKAQAGPGNGSSGGSEKKHTGLKTLLIILVLVAALPILLPLGLTMLCVAAGIVLAVVAVFAGLAIASVLVAFIGLTLVGAGIACLLPQAAAGLTLIGGGLITFVIGLVMTVAMVRACIIVLPGFFRGIIYLIRRLFHRRKAVA